MNVFDFNVDASLFNGEPTDGEYMVKVHLNDNGNFDVNYLNIEEDGTIIVNKIEVQDCKLTRKVIKEEQKDTLLKVIELNNWQAFYVINQMDYKLFNLKLLKNINLLISDLGLSSAIIIGYGINLVGNNMDKGIIYISVGSLLALSSMIVRARYHINRNKCLILEDELDEYINNEGFKLVRKK